MDEATAPTLERVRHLSAGAMESPAVDQKSERRAYRIKGVVEILVSRGSLDEDCLQTFRRFETDWLTANSVPSGVGGYGERISGTFDRQERAEIRKVLAKNRTEDALEAIPTPWARTAVVMAAQGEDGVKLETIGRACSSYASRPAAIAAAYSALREALFHLRRHYEEG